MPTRRSSVVLGARRVALTIYKTKHELIAGTAQFPVAVLGNPATADFELIALGGTEFPDIRAVERGLRYLATVGLVNGKPESHLEEPLDDVTTASLAKAYLAHVEAGLGLALEQQPN